MNAAKEHWKEVEHLSQLSDEMQQGLNQIRERWESGLNPIFEADCIDKGYRLVVCAIPGKSVRYNCYRYFMIGHLQGELKWTVSQDRTNVPLEEVFQWLLDS